LLTTKLRSLQLRQCANVGFIQPDTCDDLRPRQFRIDSVFD
jgi:hypothetical protein